MSELHMSARLAAGVAALALSLSAGAVTVSLVGDANPDELQVVISGLGGSAATADVSAFDIGMNFAAGHTLTGANMNLDLAVLDDGSGSYGSCGMGSSGPNASGGFGGCPSSKPGGVTADLMFVSFLADSVLAGVQNPSHSANFSLTLASLDFSGAVAPADVTLVWGGLHDVKGAAECPADPTGGPGTACVIFSGNPTVPEPGTLALLGFGVLAGAATLRRRPRG